MTSRIKRTSPQGTAVWPWLNEPDTRFDENGVYTVTLRLSAEDAEPFIEDLKQIFRDGYDAEVKKQKKQKLKLANMPWSDHEDDQGNETGLIDFKFKTKASYEYEGRKIDNRVHLIDAKCHPVTDQIGGGSKIRVGFEPYVWYVPSMGVGMSLRLKAVQVIDLVQYTQGQSTDEFDFKEEDGYTTAPFSKSNDAAGNGFDF
tara:strand:+ start:511 stop:1113 length:603 start_codon:yes stop_codon:yes gene_type:complete